MERDTYIDKSERIRLVKPENFQAGALSESERRYCRSVQFNFVTVFFTDYLLGHPLELSASNEAIDLYVSDLRGKFDLGLERICRGISGNEHVVNTIRTTNMGQAADLLNEIFESISRDALLPVKTMGQAITIAQDLKTYSQLLIIATTAELSEAAERKNSERNEKILHMQERQRVKQSLVIIPHSVAS